jgi:hypothetical protein
MEMSNIKRVYGFVVETRNPSDGATLSILSQAPAKLRSGAMFLGSRCSNPFRLAGVASAISPR